jgi:hypothetical protein
MDNILLLIGVIIIVWMIIITIIVSSQIFRGEALRNLSSMYNNGTLKMTNLEVTGNIKGKTLDITDNGTIGPTMIGALNGHNDYACISHKSHGLKEGKYALVQDNHGKTFINSAGNNGVNIKGNINMDNNWAIRPSTNQNMYFGTHTDSYKSECWVNAEWLYANDLIRANKRMDVKNGSLTVAGDLNVKKDLNVKGTFKHEGGAMYWFGRTAKSVSGSQVDDYGNYWFYGIKK